MKVTLIGQPFSALSNSSDGRKALSLILDVRVELTDKAETMNWARLEAGFEAVRADVRKALEMGLVQKVNEIEEAVPYRRDF